MRKWELAYLAGFFDGEGSIYITLQKGKYLRVEVSVSQNTATVLWMYVGAFKGSVYQGNRCLQWKVYGANAVGFLRSIRPFLVVKAKEAEETIQAWEKRGDLDFVNEVLDGKRRRRAKLKAHYDRIAKDKTADPR